MIGKRIDNLYPKEYCKKGEKYFEAKKLTETGIISNVSFTAYAGQITGFAALVGTGRTETMRAIFGADKLDSGELYVKGEKKNIKKPSESINAKIAFLTEERKKQGLVLTLSTRTNLIMSKFNRFKKGLFFNEKQIDKKVNENIDKLNIKIKEPNDIPMTLSGGNQQKVVLAKWMNTDADIYI